MRIVSHRRLIEFYSSEGHGDAQAALERWYDIAEKAEWKNLSDKIGRASCRERVYSGV